MLIAQLRTLMEDTGLSPEQLAESLQISGMTLRRLLRRPDDSPLPKGYEPLLNEGAHRLILSGKLAPESASAQQALGGARDLSFQAAIQALGFSQDTMALGDQPQERLIIGLSQIGASNARQGSVLRSKRQLTRFQKLGLEWKTRLDALRKVITTHQLTTFEKFAAFGALFYLLAPLDLIPDSFPVFGLVDDFAILGIVTTYYLQKFPKVFQ